LSEGEVFDSFCLKGMDKAVEVAKYYDFIEVMPPALYAPLIAKEQSRMRSYRQLIKRFD
jgi:DNA polymerase-3 subunit alpha (Gram-positive type)